MFSEIVHYFKNPNPSFFLVGDSNKRKKKKTLTSNKQNIKEWYISV